MREQILAISTQVESLLRNLGASGKGLHEKLTSVESQISPPMGKKIRFIASVRNKAVHEAEFDVDLAAYRTAGDEVIKYLRGLVDTAAEEGERRESPEPEKEPEKAWADMTGWERAATVGTYVAGGAVMLGLLFISSK